MCIFMIVPVCLLAGCAEKTDDEVTDDMTDAASEATVTIAMYLVSEQDVCTPEELAKIKDEHGATSAEYIEAKAIYDSHKKVEAEMNKITKAKFKTQVNVYWYTEDEYVTIVEKKMADYAIEVKMREEAKTEYDKFEREQIALGISNRLEIKALFDQKFPQYAEYIIITSADPDEETSETAEETIKTESGIIELKYPEEGKNQIDIVYMGGYDVYKKYVSNGWLQDLTGEFSGGSKALNAYINAAFFDAMQITVDAVDGTQLSGKFALPVNTTIGEYVYMLIDKQLYSDYYYPIDEVDQITSIADVYDFIEEIGKSTSLDVVPFTGELITSGTHFWSVDYDFERAEGIAEFADGKSYYTKNEDGSYKLVGAYIPGVEFFTKSSENNHFIANTKDSLSGVDTYYVISPNAYIKATEFVKGVVYYTIDEQGNYVVADGLTAFIDGVDYYKISSRHFVKIDPKEYRVDEGINYYVREGGEFIKQVDLKAFAAGTSYYVVRDANDEEDAEKVSMYVEYDAFDIETEYYIPNISFEANDFSLVGSVVNADADNETKLTFENIFSDNFDYADQLLAISKIKENGYYDESALTDPNKDFAVAIVKGGADLMEKYSEKYAMVMLNAPTADFSDMYDNLFAVPQASANLSRAMEVITLLNTDSEFRNLVQYGIAEENYKIEVVDINGKKYPTIERLNEYYMMDIEKTGNLFIAYPEEGMPANVWEYGKMQNRDSRLDVLANFNLATLNTPDLELLDRIAAISKEYKDQIDACETSEALELLLEELAIKADMDTTIKELIEPNKDDAKNLNNIYTGWYDKAYPSTETK